MAKFEGCIEACGARLADLDAGGVAIVVVRSESEEDIRDVVKTYVHQSDALSGLDYDPASRAVSGKTFTMREATSFGTLKKRGFYGPFTREDLPRKQNHDASEDEASDLLVDVLARAVNPHDALEGAPILIYIPSPDYLGQADAAGLADGIAHHARYGREVLYLLKQLAIAKRHGRHRVLVVIGAKPEQTIPALENEAYILDVAYPRDEEIRALIQEVYEANDWSHAPIPAFIMTNLCSLFRGFRRDRIRETLQVAYAHYDDPFKNAAAPLVADIREAKLQLLKKTAGLTWREPHDTRPGGLGNLLQWVEGKRMVVAYGDAARGCGIKLPQGVLATGVPGTGKSFAAEWVARTLVTSEAAGATFHLPLFQLDMGAIMGRYQGESEERFARALKLVEAMAPCVLFIDELDKSFSGAGTGGENNASLDRIFGRFLDWLQDADRRGAPVFVFATANHIERLPGELMRLGRFDEKFFFFMPTGAEVVDILCVHLAPYAPLIEGMGGDGALQVRGRLIESIAPAFMRAALAEGKFVTGADVATVVKETFQQLFSDALAALSQKERESFASADKPELTFAVDDVTRVLAGKLADTRVYGDTDRDELARYWLWASRKNPRNVSDAEPALSLTGYDRCRGRFSWLPVEGCANLSSADDRAYRKALVDGLQGLREIDRYRDIADLQEGYDHALAAALALELFDMVGAAGRRHG